MSMDPTQIRDDNYAAADQAKTRAENALEGYWTRIANSPGFREAYESKLVRDSLSSGVTGSGYLPADGSAPRDPTMTYKWQRNIFTPTSCATFYNSSHIAKRVVDLPAQESLRQGFTVSYGDDAKVTEELGHRLQDLHFPSILLDAFRKSRLFGGCGILLTTNDKDYSEPLDPGTEITGLVCYPVGLELFTYPNYINNPHNPHYGFPRFYNIIPIVPGEDHDLQKLDNIHHSRFALLSEWTSSRVDRISRLGFGPSVLETAFWPIHNYSITMKSLGEMTPRWDTGIFHLPGLRDSQGTSRADDVISAVQAIDLSRGNSGSILLDAGVPGQKEKESFEHVNPKLDGIQFIPQQEMLDISAASSIPVSILMGRNPAGLNATGDSEVRAFYDFCKSLQIDHLTKPIEKVASAVLAELGQKFDPAKLKITFHPLWQPTANELAEEDKTQAEADKIKFDMMTANRDLYNEIVAARKTKST